MANLGEMVRELTQERSRAVQQVRKLDKAITALRKAAGSSGLSLLRKPARRKRTLSVAARRRIAVAQRARWAKWKAAQKKAA